MEAVTDKIKEAIFPLSSAFTQVKLLVQISSSLDHVYAVSILFLVLRVKKETRKVTVCTRVYYLSRNKGVNCKHQKIIFVQ